MATGATTLNLDGPHWLERWESMMSAYNPHRRQCFSLMLHLARLPAERPIRILDLGCGPGALSFEAKRYYPRSQVTALDFDPILLDLARKVACARALDIEFVQQDLRDEAWWADKAEHYDCAFTALALHWLSRDSHRQLYHHLFRALKPGGQFWNADHMSCDNPLTQETHRQHTAQVQERAFQESGAEKWNDFWKALLQEAGLGELEMMRRASQFWEGSDEGQPKNFHMESLRQAGFEKIRITWQDMCNAVIAARKPEAAASRAPAASGYAESGNSRPSPQ